jgi:hypothetical protein
MDARWSAGIHSILSDPDLDPPGNDPCRRFTPDLALGPPEQVPVPGLLQVEMRDLLEAACCVEARRELAGERLVVDESVRPSRGRRPLIETPRVDITALEARNLGDDECGPVLEVRRTVFGSLLELAMVSSQFLLVPNAFGAGCRLAERGPRQRGRRIRTLPARRQLMITPAKA